MPAFGRSMLRRTAWRKRDSTEGWMAVHCSLITRWIRAASSSTLRFTAIEQSGRASPSRMAPMALRSPGRGEPRSSVPMSSSW